MFNRAEMVFETSFQNDVVPLRTQTQKERPFYQNSRSFLTFVYIIDANKISFA